MEDFYKEFKDILTVPEVCVMLRMCPARVYKLLNEGQIKAFRCDRAWCIPKQSVKNFVEKYLNTNK